MKKFSMLILLMIVLCLSLPQCNLPKRFVGERINYYDPHFCKIDQLPKSCTLNTKYLIFEFEISKSDNLEEYVIKGSAKGQGAGAIGTLQTGGELGGSKFNLLIASDNVIIDNISFMLSRRGFSGNLGRKIPFKRAFKSAPFDALGITYMLVVSD